MRKKDSKETVKVASSKKKIIVTKRNMKISGYVVLKSIKGIDWSGVQGIVFNNSEDDDLTVMLELSRLKDNLSFIIYTNNTIRPLFFSLFNGLNADIYADESCLEDKEILDFIVNKFGKTGFTIPSPKQDFQALYKNISDILSANTNKSAELLGSDLWKKTVNGALATVDTALARSNQINSDMVEILSKAHKYNAELMENNKAISKELESINETVANAYSNGISSSPILYPCYRVPSSTKKVLYIKFYSHCPYIKSLLLAYQHYIRSTFLLSSRILLILPSLPSYTTRYSDMSRLASDSIGVISQDDERKWGLCCTFEPKRSIMEKFFSTNNDIYFVIDEMYGNDLISGAHVLKYNAVCGLKDLDRFNLSPKQTFFAISGAEQGLIIPYIKDYKDGTDTVRRTKYFNNCKDLFERLNGILGVQG